jgi:EAL domain-containing protein (putative c-di-GMP-specific phosphodiesterase class I)
LLGLRTVAEFVEDAQTLELLNYIGVDYAQGNHFGPARPTAL